MGLVLLFAGALWLLGHFVGASRRDRLILLAVVYGLVLLAHVLLPEAHPFRLATGGGPAPWLILGGVAALAFGYARLVRFLRDKTKAKETAEAPSVSEDSGPFAAGELDRYARHIVLRELGGPGQFKLKQAKVLVVGAGGLGSPALLYLAAAGVGQIGVIDDDEVEAANLQRQVLHADDRIGMPKVQSAQQAMLAVNPFVEVRPYHRRLIAEEAEALIGDYDIVLDGCDNFETRYLVNRATAKLGKPLVSGALSQWEGQVSVFDPAHGTPCYQCIFAKEPAAHLAPSCAEAGVLSPLPGVVGSLMAVETIKLITGAGQALRGEMLIYDALWGETRKIALNRRTDCPVCGSS